MVETITSFMIYLLFLLSIGFYFYKRTKDLEDYLIGGRAMGSWVTALSAQASDMSGWLLMGLPGAVFLGGMSQTWIAIGLFIGTFLNWKFVAARLRVYTEKTDSMTLPSYFADRFKDPTGLLRIFSAIIILFFFTIYSASGLVAAGKLFEVLFDINYLTAVFLGGMVIVAYTFLGGFMAVCWTDLFQGILMFIAITIVPILAYNTVGGSASISDAMALKDISMSLVPKGFTIVTIISAMAWGLGYFGQPHILARFMGIKSAKQFPKAMRIAVIWVLISLSAAVVVGLIAVPMFPEIGDSERVFIEMVKKVFNPWLGGIFLAAILSAIMSTIDSQLLVSSSTLTEDFYSKIIKKDASPNELMWVGRICVLLISVIAFFLAMNPSSTVLGLVAYAWGGFGAAFGPVVLFSLFSRNTNWQSALAGMLAGTIVLVAWKQLGYSSIMYEIVPGFIVNSIAIFVVNLIVGQEDDKILAEFDEVNEMIVGEMIDKVSAEMAG